MRIRASRGCWETTPGNNLWAPAHLNARRVFSRGVSLLMVMRSYAWGGGKEGQSLRGEGREEGRKTRRMGQVQCQ